MSDTKSISEKMGIKQGSRTIFIHAPADRLPLLHLPELNISSHLSGYFDYIHLFSTTLQELEQHCNKLYTHLRPAGMMWVSWPKAKQLGTDLNIKNVIKTGYDHGLVESKNLSLDSIWTALKFTHPKKNKVYNNSYGKLKT